MISSADFSTSVYCYNQHFSSTAEVLQTDMLSVKVHTSEEVPCINNDLLLHCMTAAFKFRAKYSHRLKSN